VLGLGLVSGASAQVTPVVAADSITAAGINAIIDAVNRVVTSVDGNLDLPTTTSTGGHFLVNGTRFLHPFGSRNTFLGANAGNFTLTGNDNTGIGSTAVSCRRGAAGAGNAHAGRPSVEDLHQR
jgi:hypothetical protein